MERSSVAHLHPKRKRLCSVQLDHLVEEERLVSGSLGADVVELHSESPRHAAARGLSVEEFCISCTLRVLSYCKIHGVRILRTQTPYLRLV